MKINIEEKDYFEHIMKNLCYKERKILRNLCKAFAVNRYNAFKIKYVPNYGSSNMGSLYFFRRSTDLDHLESFTHYLNFKVNRRLNKKINCLKYSLNNYCDKRRLIFRDKNNDLILKERFIGFFSYVINNEKHELLIKCM